MISHLFYKDYNSIACFYSSIPIFVTPAQRFLGGTTMTTMSNMNFAGPLAHQRTVGSFADHEPGLWRAVITQALMDASSESRKSESKQARDVALKWLLGDSLDFEIVCDNAGFDPDYVRSRAREALHRGCEWRLPNGQGWRTQARLNGASPSYTTH
jgi:hypothetical protein